MTYFVSGGHKTLTRSINRMVVTFPVDLELTHPNHPSNPVFKFWVFLHVFSFFPFFLFTVYFPDAFFLSYLLPYLFTL